MPPAGLGVSFFFSGLQFSGYSVSTKNKIPAPHSVLKKNGTIDITAEIVF